MIKEEKQYRSVPEKAADFIREKIFIDKYWKPSERLPNERKLSEILGIGRGSTREAVKLLVSEGVLINKRGSGVYVCENPVNIKDPLGILSFENKKNILIEWYDFRIILEPELVKMAVKEATDEELCEIVHLATDEMDKIETDKDFAGIDSAFHIAIAKASHNRAVLKIVPLLEEAVAIGVEMASMASITEKVLESAKDFHQKISYYINRRDGYNAALYMQAHILNGRETIENSPRKF